MKNVYMKAPSGEVFTTSNPEYHKGCTRLTISAGKLARKEYARAELRKLIAPGQRVHCVLRNVSGSGMSRRISLFITTGDDLRNIDMLTASAIGWKVSEKGGIVVSGCGMDMGFHIVYTLGYALWPHGTPEPHGKRNGEPDSDGGYALKHEWV